MRSWRVRGPGRLDGIAEVPGDKSIAQRLVLLGAVASGTSRLARLPDSLDVRSALGMIEALGVTVRREPGVVVVEGRGLDGMRAPAAVLDAGNSGTAMRIGTGLFAGQPFGFEMVGDPSLSRRPMRRVTDPLRAMGARVRGRGLGPREGEEYAPIASEGRAGPFVALSYESPVASAQVKSALLCAALYAPDGFELREPLVSRDHTERLLGAMGAPIRTLGGMVALDPQGWDHRLAPVDVVVPGDLSAAAFLFAAAAITGSGSVEIGGVGINPTRTGVLDALRGAGVKVSFVPGGESGGEPIADVTVHGRPLGPLRVAGELLVRAIDEFPILAAVAAVSPAGSYLHDASELRLKESDRVAAMAAVLRAFGVSVREEEDGLDVEGVRGRPLRAASVTSRGDHRIAMTAAVLALAADGESTIEDVDCVDTSFPCFLDTLRALGADAEEVSS
jgi:3-phosphoshikimate 1-carboxyvinyltransferase